MATKQSNTKLLDKSFQKSKVTGYKLYVEISYCSIKQLVLDTSSNTFIGFQKQELTNISNDFTLTNELKKFVKEDELFNHNYKSVYVSVVNNRSTLIPNAIYKSERLESYHHFNFLIQEDDKFYADKLININTHNVYSISKKITDVFGHLKNLEFKHFSSSLIEAALIDAKANKALSSIYVNVLSKSFQIIVIKNQKLELYNSFNYQSNEDFIYYLLFVLEQLNINNEEATIKLSGNIQKNTNLYTALYKYINTLNFISPSGNLKKSYIFEETPVHFHHGLFNLYLCE